MVVADVWCVSCPHADLWFLPMLVLYHQPEKMAKSKEDLAERQENLEKLKRQHGIE